MKLVYFPILAAVCGISYAVPNPLMSGIPEFLDADGDGKISEAERQAFVESRRAAGDEENDDNTTGGPAAWDTDGNGTVDAEEREAAIAGLRGRMEQRRTELFDSLAGDDGILTLEEFSSLAPFSEVPEETVARLFDLLDADDDGEVSLEEFLARVGRPAPAAGTPGGPPSEP